jgi:hypothetical protein
VIEPANAGGDAINSIKQAAEFGIVPGSQKFVNLPAFINDVDGWGLRSHKACCSPTAFYADQDGEIRAWSWRFLKPINKLPNMGRSVSVRQQRMTSMPSRPPRQAKSAIHSIKHFARDVHIRLNGQMTHAIVSLRGQAAFDVQGTPPWGSPSAVLADWARRGDDPSALQRSNRATWQALLMPVQRNVDPDRLRRGDRCDDPGQMRLLALPCVGSGRSAGLEDTGVAGTAVAIGQMVRRFADTSQRFAKHQPRPIGRTGSPSASHQRSMNDLFVECR